jgi:hypothetical protein
MAQGVGASPVAANELALTEVERAVPAAPESIKAGRGALLIYLQA